MNTAQKWIDALRNNDYYEVCHYQNDLLEQYKGILSQDDFTPMTIYELCKTDINIEDIHKLRFLNEYFFSKQIICGNIMNPLTTLCAEFPISIQMKADATCEEVIQSIEIKNKDDLNNCGRFTALEQKSMEQAGSLRDLLYLPLKESELRQKIIQMKDNQFAIFATSVERLKIKYELNFDCPLINERKNEILLRNKIIQIASDYRDHLQTKIDKAGLTNDSDLISSSQADLLIRYNALNDFLNLYKYDSNVQNNMKQTGSDVLKICLNHHPDWSERPFLQKFTDVLSFGFKPLYRAYFSPEVRLASKLEDAYEKDNVQLKM